MKPRTHPRSLLLIPSSLLLRLALVLAALGLACGDNSRFMIGGDGGGVTPTDDMGGTGECSLPNIRWSPN